MTKDEAVAELAAVAVGFEALRAAAAAADDDCWWCCGGGDEWYTSLTDRREAVLAEHPEFAPANG